jgi:invasion protein IalB
MRNLCSPWASLLWAPIVAGGLAVLAAGDAAAQERTTATYDSWVVTCQTAPGPTPVKTCEMVQVAQVQGRNIPFSRVAIEHPVRGKPTKLLVQVPVNVSLAGTMRLQTSNADPGLTAPFDRCVPAGCFAEFAITDDTIRKFRSTTENGRITFKNAAGRDVAIPLSFKGFGQAFDALSAE